MKWNWENLLIYFAQNTVCCVGRWICASLLWEYNQTNACQKSSGSKIWRKEAINQRPSKKLYKAIVTIMTFVAIISLNLNSINSTAHRGLVVDASSNKSRWSLHWKWQRISALVCVSQNYTIIPSAKSILHPKVMQWITFSVEIFQTVMFRREKWLCHICSHSRRKEPDTNDTFSSCTNKRRN